MLTALASLEALIKAHPDGMLPVHPCKRCGEPLGKPGYPAEVYLGTYTGLCYTCQNGGPYRDGEYTSGAQAWNWPPHCPAWRRDREHFIGFAGCPTCQGRGRLMVSRANSQGGPFSRNCESCSTRHYAHNATREEAATAQWFMYRRGLRSPAEVALYILGVTGHVTRTTAEKSIRARRAKKELRK